MDDLDSRWLVFLNSEDERHSSPHESEVYQTIDSQPSSDKQVTEIFFDS